MTCAKITSPDAINTSLKDFFEYLVGLKTAEGADTTCVARREERLSPSSFRL
jgi:hypothetical protein